MVAVVAGSLLQLLPATPVRVAAGLGFLVFAVVAARRPVEDEDDAIAREQAELDATLGAEAAVVGPRIVGSDLAGDGQGGASLHWEADAPGEASLNAEAGTAVASKASARPPWLMCFLVVFAAEWGDLTQLATAALVARTGQPIPVAIGATAALWTVTLLAVVAGSQLTRYLNPRLLKWISVAVFALVGAVILISAFELH